MNCNGHLDDAALWLTQNAVPISYQNSPGESINHQIGESIFSFNNMEVGLYLFIQFNKELFK